MISVRECEKIERILITCSDFDLFVRYMRHDILTAFQVDGVVRRDQCTSDLGRFFEEKDGSEKS